MNVHVNLDTRGLGVPEKGRLLLVSWCSVVKPGNRLHETVFERGAVLNYKFDLPFDASVGLPFDATLYFQFYGLDNADDEEHSQVWTETGSAHVLLSDVIEAKQTLHVRALSLLIYHSGSGSMDRGSITVGVATSVDPVFAEPNPKTALVPGNEHYTDAIMRDEVMKAIVVGDDASRISFHGDVGIFLTEAMKIRSRYYTNIAHPYAPGYLYMRIGPADRPPSEDALVTQFSYALRRSGRTLQWLDAKLNELCSDANLGYEQLLALEVVALGMRTLANSTIYRTDVVALRDGSLLATERYGDMLRSGSDCEEKGRFPAANIAVYLRDHAQSLKSPMLRSVSRVLQFYVVIMGLMSVRGAQHGDGNGVDGGLKNEDGVGAHMQCTLIPRALFLTMLRRTYPSIEDLPPEVASVVLAKKWEEKLPVLFIEGTGDMVSLQQPIWSGVADAVQARAYRKNLDSVYACIFDHVRFMQNADAAPAPTGPWCDMEFAAWPREKKEGRAGEANSFYRLIVNGFVVSEDFPIEARTTPRTSYVSMDFGTTLRLDGRRGNFMRGAPVYDLANQSPDLRVVLAPAPSNEALELFENLLCHLPPFRKLSEDGQADMVQRALKLKKEWVAVMPLPSDDPLLNDDREPVACFAVSLRRATADLGRKLAAHLSANPHVLETYVGYEVLLPTVANLVLMVRVSLELPRRGPVSR